MIDPAGNCTDEGHGLQHIEKSLAGCICINLPIRNNNNLACFFWVIIWYVYSGGHDHLNCYFNYCHDRFYECNIFDIYWIEKCQKWHVCAKVLLAVPLVLTTLVVSSLAVPPNIFEFINIHYTYQHTGYIVRTSLYYLSRKHLHLHIHHNSDIVTLTTQSRKQHKSVMINI